MAFWDKVKGVANDAMNTLSDAAKDVTESAKEMNEKSKINRAIKVEEGKINNLYMVMGEKFLMKILLHLPVLKISLPESIQLKEIERLKQELSNIESASKCPKCGAKISQGQKFCQGCGNNLDTQSAGSATSQDSNGSGQVIVTQGQEVTETPASSESNENN